MQTDFRFILLKGSDRDKFRKILGDRFYDAKNKFYSVPVSELTDKEIELFDVAGLDAADFLMGELD